MRFRQRSHRVHRSSHPAGGKRPLRRRRPAWHRLPDRGARSRPAPPHGLPLDCPSDALVMLQLMLEGQYVRRGVAEFVGTFALVFIGVGSLIYRDIVGRRVRARARDRRDGLVGRPDLRRALQSGRHARLPRHPPDLRWTRGVLLDRAARSRDPGCALDQVGPATSRKQGHPRRRSVAGYRAQPRQGRRDRGRAHVLPALGGLRHGSRRRMAPSSRSRASRSASRSRSTS